MSGRPKIAQILYRPTERFVNERTGVAVVVGDTLWLRGRQPEGQPSTTPDRDIARWTERLLYAPKWGIGQEDRRRA